MAVPLYALLSSLACSRTRHFSHMKCIKCISVSNRKILRLLLTSWALKPFAVIAPDCEAWVVLYTFLSLPDATNIDRKNHINRCDQLCAHSAHVQHRNLHVMQKLQKRLASLAYLAVCPVDAHCVDIQHIWYDIYYIYIYNIYLIYISRLAIITL